MSAELRAVIRRSQWIAFSLHLQLALTTDSPSGASEVGRLEDDGVVAVARGEVHDAVMVRARRPCRRGQRLKLRGCGMTN